MTSKQLEVVRYLHTVSEATSYQIYKNVSWGYYHNGRKHLSALLSRMVKNGYINRVRKGVFKFNATAKINFTLNPKQLELFNV